MSENHWLRLYNGILDDPKVQSLPGETFKFWINTLCVASKHGGVIKDLPFFLRMPPTKISKFITELLEVGLIEEINGFLMPHNWDKRQFVSDGTSTERVKKHREKQKGNISGNENETFHGTVSGNENETPPDTDTDTDTDTEKTKSEKRVSKSSFDLCELWKLLCPSLPQIRGMTAKREKKIRLRLKEHPERGYWEEIFAKIEQSSFCHGEGSTGWKATFDWIIENEENGLKTLEGKYDDKAGNDDIDFDDPDWHRKWDSKNW